MRTLATRLTILVLASVVVTLGLWSIQRETARLAGASPEAHAPARPEVASAVPERSGEPAPPAAAPADPGGSAAREHVVAEGETLGQLAQQYYGDVARAEALYAANRDRIRDPAHLHAGQTLVIP